MDRSVDRRAGDGEQLGKLSAGMPALRRATRWASWRGLSLGLPRSRAAGAGDLHAFAGPHPNQVRFEFGLSRHRCGQVSAFWPWDRVTLEARQTLTTPEAIRPDWMALVRTGRAPWGSWSDAISLVAGLFRAVKDAAARLAALGPSGHP
jgi:hypothetical protein